MPKCPKDGTELVRIFDGYLECTVDKSRYRSTTWELVPEQRAVVSIPGAGETAVTNLIRDDLTGNLKYDYYGGGSQPIGGGGDLTYKELTTNGINAGNSNLTDSNWGISKSSIDCFTISVASGNVSDFDIAIYEKDTFLAADKRYEVKNIDANGWTDDLEWNYLDRDNTNEIHIKITENPGTGTYNAHFRGIKLI